MSCMNQCVLFTRSALTRVFHFARKTLDSANGEKTGLVQTDFGKHYGLMGALFLLLGGGSATAQILAHDDAASYAGGNAWGGGMNLGFGFLPWVITSSGPGQQTVFIGDGGNIATASNSAWALHAYGTP